MDHEILPAGLYFRPGNRLSAACRGCPRPEFAGLIGLYPNVKLAERALRSVPPGLLPPGYPWVVMAEDLMLADRRTSGIAIVAALVTDKGAAARLSKAWRKQARIPLRVAKLADGQEAERRLQRRVTTDAQGEKRPAVVQTDPGPAVDAYDEAALESGDVPDVKNTAVQLTSVCQVPPGALFVFASQHHLHRFGRRYAPARCGDKPVFIPWTRTLIETMVARRADGFYQLSQVVDVTCERPRLDDWVFDREGRQARVPKPPADPATGGAKPTPARRGAPAGGARPTAPGGC
jgi:hypothetical protein